MVTSLWQKSVWKSPWKSLWIRRPQLHLYLHLQQSLHLYVPLHRHHRLHLRLRQY
jgi:hypothetical protein